MAEPKRILIVEDDEFLRSLAATRLEKEGFIITVAVDGEAALGVAVANKPDLILLDLLLPGMSGFDLLPKFKNHDLLKSVPVLVFSNLGSREDIAKAQSLGADNFLIKAQFTLDDLVQKIREALKLS